MQFRASSFSSLSDVSSPVLVVPVFGKELSGTAADLDSSLQGLVTTAVEDGFSGSSGQTRSLYTNGQLPTARVLLLGLGALDKLTLLTWRHASAKAARAVRDLKKSGFSLVATPEALEKLGVDDASVAFAEGVTLGLHHVHEFKTDEETKAMTWVDDITLLVASENVEAAQKGVEAGYFAAHANLRARSWVNLPSNMKSPQLLAEQASQICDRHGLQGEFWDEKRVLQEKMGALYGVGMGSDNPPRFLRLDYTPAGTENDAPIILVGKGMTFDSGGYSIKTSQGMEDMKDDMAGAAVVLGVMSALSELNYSKRVIGLVPTAENMINGHAQRPGDIVTARNGKTIEVLNTDAEGRLILADALSYASELKPQFIIDYATLTGAIGIALGQEAAGLFSNDDELAGLIEAAGQKTGERVWRFPMWDEYKEHVKGTISDLKNIGVERRAGSIAGAVFLENFVAEGIPWAHIDIAAVALIREDRPLVKRGATGFGVRLTLELLKMI